MIESYLVDYRFNLGWRQKSFELINTIIADTDTPEEAINIEYLAFSQVGDKPTSPNPSFWNLQGASKK